MTRREILPAGPTAAVLSFLLVSFFSLSLVKDSSNRISCTIVSLLVLSSPTWFLVSYFLPHLIFLYLRQNVYCTVRFVSRKGIVHFDRPSQFGPKMQLFLLARPTLLFDPTRLVAHHANSFERVCAGKRATRTVRAPKRVPLPLNRKAF